MKIYGTSVERRFVITFLVAGTKDTWTETITGESYSDAEWKALEILATKNDRQSMIVGIKLV